MTLAPPAAMLVGLLLLATVFYTSLAVPTFAEAAGWVLIAPPRQRNGDYVQNVPVNGWWMQLAAFDNAAQCEQQRMVEINSWRGHMDGTADGEHKEWLNRRWMDAFLLRCVPYDFWWRAQQPSR
jgi:hypothetical protein